MKLALLPVLFVLATACKDKGIQPPRTARADSADQIYSAMTTTVTRGGVRQSDVYADSAWNYQAREVIDLKGMTVTMFDSSGAKISTIVADKGIYHPREQSLDARGHVVATSSGGKVLKTEHLIYDTNKNQISSDTFFTSTSPTGNISGAHFYADPGFKNVVVNKMKLLQKGRGITLPGQHGGGTP